MLKKDKDKIEKIIKDIKVSIFLHVAYLSYDDVNFAVKEIAEYLDKRGYRIYKENKK